MFFSRECCRKCIEYDKRLPGLFHIEKIGTKYIGLSSKKFLIQNSNSEIGKLSFCGLSKSNFNSKKSIDTFFRKPLFFNEMATGVNFGIKVNNVTKTLHIYKQIRTFVPGFYIKRKIKKNGIDTLPLQKILIPCYNSPNNVEFIHNTHYLSLKKKINIIYKGEFYCCFEDFIYMSFTKESSVETKIEETKLFIMKCLKMNIYNIKIIKKYVKRHLLFPGVDTYLTTNISTFLQLYFQDFNSIKGSNKLLDIYRDIAKNSC